MKKIGVLLQQGKTAGQKVLVLSALASNERMTYVYEKMEFVHSNMDFKKHFIKG